MNISKKALSALTLLIIPGILLMPYVTGWLIIFPALMCAFGGIGFGALIGKK